MPAVRSEQTFADHSNGASVASGVPGALSNQPPVTPSGAKGQTNQGNATKPDNSVSRITRNYELDKTVSHTKYQTGTVRKISIAVVVDDHKKTNDDGTEKRTPRTEE